MDRREFLAALAAGTCALKDAQAGRAQEPQDTGGEDPRTVREARYYEKLPEKKAKCVLCPRECQVADRERGTCGVRENRDGTYYTLVYANPCSLTPRDPVEKKPLFHFLPGTRTFSLATVGCNIACKFCQNWDISQKRPEQVPSRYTPPEEVTRLAKEYSIPTIAYTYSEPVIFYEYMYDCAAAGRKLGIRSVMISNGYIQEKPLRELCTQLDAVKIDFKAFTEKFYKEMCNGELKPVMETLRILRKVGMWFEIVVLIIPTLNDSKQEIGEMCKWIAGELGPDVPVHFTRYHPTYMIQNIPPTPVKTLETAYGVGRKAGLRYVYVGNVPGHPTENTPCPKCGKTLVERYGYFIKANRIRKGCCGYCGEKIPGVWS